MWVSPSVFHLCTLYYYHYALGGGRNLKKNCNDTFAKEEMGCGASRIVEDTNEPTRADVPDLPVRRRCTIPPLPPKTDVCALGEWRARWAM
mgnify:FL=1